MPEIPRITGEEAIAAFQAAGFFLDRIKGSHHILKRDGHIYLLSIPVHAGKTIGKGLLGRLIRDSGLSDEEFLGHL